MSRAAGITTQVVTNLDNTFGAILIGTLFSTTYVKFLSFLHGTSNSTRLVYGEWPARKHTTTSWITRMVNYKNRL